MDRRPARHTPFYLDRRSDGPVLAACARDNAELIEDACRLGHLDPARDRVIDLTYGEGRWWRIIRPVRFDRIDIAPSPKAADYLLIRRMDGTALPGRFAGRYDVAAVDPPYKLNGTATEAVDRPYGVHEYASVADRHDLAWRLMAEAHRVLRPGGRLLYKCMDQVNAGSLRWQTFDAYRRAAGLGMTLIERMEVLGGRKQPERTRWRCLACGRDNTGPSHACRAARSPGWQDWAALQPPSADSRRPWLVRYPSRQEHAAYRPSTLLIFQKAAA